MPRVNNRLMLTVPAHPPSCRRACLVTSSRDASPEGHIGQGTVVAGALGYRRTGHGMPVMATSFVELVCQSSRIDRRVARKPVMAW
jgi:hypothetical protein